MDTINDHEPLVRDINQSLAQKTLYIDPDPVKFWADRNQTFDKPIQRVFQAAVDAPWVAAKSATGTGKSYGIAHWLVWFYKRYPGALVFTLAAPPESNLKNNIWKHIGDITRKHPDLFTGDRISLPGMHISSIVNGEESFITGLAIPVSANEEQIIARFSGKHARALAFAIDEADGVVDPIYTAIRGCMSGGEVSRLIALLNPRRKGGEVYRRIKDGNANVIQITAFDHINVITGEDIYPGAVTRNAVVNYTLDWTRPIVPGESEDGSFDIPDYLVGVRAKKDDGSLSEPLPAGKRKIKEDSHEAQAYSYVILGEYPGQDVFSLIPESLLQRARKNYDEYVSKYGLVPPLVIPIGGLDVAELGDDSNALAIRYDNFILPIETWKGLFPFQTARKAQVSYEQYKLQRLMIDAIGVGCDVPPLMRKQRCKAYGVKVSERPTETTQLNKFSSLRDQIFWAFAMWLQRQDAMLPPNARLIESAQLLTYMVDPKRGIVVISTKELKKKLGYSPDELMAVAMTFAPANADNIPLSDSTEYEPEDLYV